ncbi:MULTISPECIES: helix-turn-helix transcriptional regulator [Clostridium]|uniref:Helix-turn-helix transcriptional regulator n=2 Tax=Clostridium TaxID=1485 RepID=A0A7Y3SXV9_9CLOT|nr:MULTISPECIES: helix-turn-helix transcriptional regulator [Clostridium]MBU3102276.1 helix-turn-helix transcriptional regulator [Clostridium sp. DSM 17811]MBW9173302.1 helix-turn-helix transcriptional regulator [Clostridium estertheticum]MBX4263071.1 helix-turn-helix transcriptional regulator [Clostridium estertheticum]MBX4271141.1 helix-turn-helix transcriptional regulator [Clostridium estertheticum]MCB2308591.1 helix-turn-helix transcriptional regulator [Clostridium estertheticum]
MKNHIKELREGRNLTQEDLAKSLGTSRQTIISLEKGKYNPSIMLAYKLSKVFNKKIEEVFIFEEE